MATVGTEAGTRDFTGKLRTESIGLFYFGARWQDPEAGRFSTIDPILFAPEPQAHNAYSYAINDPVNRIDPDGRCIYDITYIASTGATYRFPVDAKGAAGSVVFTAKEIRSDGTSTTSTVSPAAVEIVSCGEGELGGGNPSGGDSPSQSAGDGIEEITITAKQDLPDWALNPWVHSRMEAGWMRSLPFSDSVQRGTPGSWKKENGAWVYRNAVTGKYKLHWAKPGQRDILPGMGRTAPPSGGKGWVPVGWFHTHPNLTSEGGPGHVYVYSPSGPDENLSTTWNLTGVVVAPDGYYVDSPGIRGTWDGPFSPYY